MGSLGSVSPESRLRVGSLGNASPESWLRVGSLGSASPESWLRMGSAGWPGSRAAPLAPSRPAPRRWANARVLGWIARRCYAPADAEAKFGKQLRRRKTRAFFTDSFAAM